MASQEPRMEMVNGEMVLHFTNFSGSIVIKSSTKEQQTKRELTSASSNVGSSNCGNKRVFDAATNSKDQGDKKIDAEKEKENKPSSHAEEQKLASPSPQKPLTTSASSLSAAAVSSSSSSSSSRKTKKARKDGGLVSPSPSAISIVSPTQHRPAGSPPQGRWGHTALMIGPNRMVVYGGEGDDAQGAPCTFGDLFVYELGPDGKQGKWEKPLNCYSIPRSWHSATYLADKNLLVAFGGERMEGGSTVPEVLDECMVLDTQIFLWYPPAISGKAPSARSGHTASLVRDGKDIVIFGGSRGRKWQNNVTVLDVDRWHWRTPAITGDTPPGRSYHSAVVIKDGKEIVYFGGNDGSKCFQSVHVLKVGREDEAWQWFHPEVVGSTPAKRTGHAACLIGDGKTILIQGGWDPQDETQDETKMFDDAFLLDTEGWEWKEVTKEIKPSPGLVVGHTAQLAHCASSKATKEEEDKEEEKGETRVMIFGGQDKIGGRREELYLINV